MTAALLIIAVFAVMTAVSVMLHLLPALARRARRSRHQGAGHSQQPPVPGRVRTGRTSVTPPSWLPAVQSFTPADRPGDPAQPGPAQLPATPLRRPGTAPPLALPTRAGTQPESTSRGCW